MPLDEFLLERIDRILTRKKVEWSGKKMFGGYCYMVDGKMCPTASCTKCWTI